MSNPAHTRTLVERLFELPHDIHVMIWEIMLNRTRVLNLEFNCANNGRCTWLFGRSHIEKLTYPARLIDPGGRLNFPTIDSFNRTVQVAVYQGRLIDFSLSLERDIFFLRSFHSSNMMSTSLPVDTVDASLTELKRLRRVMVSSNEIMSIITSHGNPQWSWYEERFFGPIGRADSQVREYIVLLDDSPLSSHIWADDLIIHHEDEMLNAIASPSSGQNDPALTAGQNLRTHVQTISAAWRAWAKAGAVRLPELSFAIIEKLF